jgi:hypothetical protein
MVFYVAASFQIADGAITGNIADRAGKPIPNAQIMLAGKGVQARSDINGAYSLNANISVVSPHREFRNPSVKISRNSIELALYTTISAAVEIFDVKGSLLQKRSLPDAAGVHHFNLPEFMQNAGTLVIRISAGGERYLLRCVPMMTAEISSARTLTAVPAKTGTITGGTAVIDTLKVTAVNYLPKSITVTTFDTTLNVVLDTATQGNLSEMNFAPLKQGNVWVYTFHKDGGTYGMLPSTFSETTQHTITITGQSNSVDTTIYALSIKKNGRSIGVQANLTPETTDDTIRKIIDTSYSAVIKRNGKWIGTYQDYVSFAPGSGIIDSLPLFSGATPAAEEVFNRNGISYYKPVFKTYEQRVNPQFGSWVIVYRSEVGMASCFYSFSQSHLQYSYKWNLKTFNGVPCDTVPLMKIRW